MLITFWYPVGMLAAYEATVSLMNDIEEIGFQEMFEKVFKISKILLLGEKSFVKMNNSGHC